MVPRCAATLLLNTRQFLSCKPVTMLKSWILLRRTSTTTYARAKERKAGSIRVVLKLFRRRMQQEIPPRWWRVRTGRLQAAFRSRVFRLAFRQTGINLFRDPIRSRVQMGNAAQPEMVETHLRTCGKTGPIYRRAITRL